MIGPHLEDKAEDKAPDKVPRVPFALLSKVDTVVSALDLVVMVVSPDRPKHLVHGIVGMLWVNI